MTQLREALEAAYDEAEKKETEFLEKMSEEEILEDDAGESKITEDEAPESDNAEDNAADQVDLEEAPEIDIPAPDSWSGAVKEKWAELPPEVRAEIKRREDDFHKGMTKLDEDRNFGLRMKETLSPYMAIIQAENAKPEDVLKGYLNIEYTLRQGTPQQKAHIIQNVMRNFNIDPQMVMQPQQQMNPEMMMLQNELMGLKQQLSQKDQLQQQAEIDRIISEINAFASDPANKYFFEVQDQMVALFESKQAADLKEAYETAIWANPSVRSRLLAEQEAAKKVKRQKEIEAKKKAASSLSTTSGQNGQSGKNNPKELRDELSAGLDAIMGTSRL